MTELALEAFMKLWELFAMITLQQQYSSAVNWNGYKPQLQQRISASVIVKESFCILGQADQVMVRKYNREL